MPPSYLFMLFLIEVEITCFLFIIMLFPYTIRNVVLCVLFKCRKHVDEEETAAGCIHLIMKHRTQTATTQLCCGCLCFVSLPRGVLSVITAFPGHTHLLLWMFSFFLQALQLAKPCKRFRL